MFKRYNLKKLTSNYKKLGLFFIVLLLIYLSGCSSAHRYKTLSFFFDGVPNKSGISNNSSKDSLNSMDSSGIGQNSIHKSPPKLNLHSPYQANKCSLCHDQNTMGKLTQALPELCYQCHADFSSKYKVLHGPVAGGQCTMCHSPHSSVNDHLLIRTGQLLCLYCHDSKQVMKEEVHQEIGDANCTECHNPHGGKERYILN